MPHGYRYYDPDTGWWLSRDPLGEMGGMNLYGFVLNDPVNMIDPLGLFYFGKRPLGNPESVLIGGPEKVGGIDDILNTEVAHEHGFFEDGSGENVGFGPKGRYWNEDTTGRRYSYYIDKKYDDAIIRQALKNLKGKEGLYSLIGNNCQDWADMLREEYDRIINNPCP